MPAPGAAPGSSGAAAKSAEREIGGAGGRRALTARGLVLVLAGLVLGLFAADRLGGAALDALYRAGGASPLNRILAADPKVLVLGSSVSKYAIDPAYFLPRSYNGAANGQGLFYAAALLRNLPRGTPVRRVILGIDPAELSTGYGDPNFRHLARLAPLARDDPWLRRQIGHGDPWAWLKNLSHLYFYRGAVHAILKRGFAPARPGSGFEALNGVRHPVPADGEAKAGVSTKASTRAKADAGAAGAVTGAPPWPVAAESLEALDMLLRAAAARHIQVIGVVIPLLGRLRAREPRFSAVMAAFRQRLAAAGMCDLTAVSAPGLARIRGDARLYFDGPHMNGAGARAYSPILARLIATRCGPPAPDLAPGLATDPAPDLAAPHPSTGAR